MSTRSPLDGIELVLIDGNNLLHRRREGLGESALRRVLVDIQRVLPSGVRTEVILDGHPAAGTPMRQKIRTALEVRHAGGAADEAIVAAIAAQPWQARARTIVVTDDRALADRTRSAGALPRRLDWFAALPAAPTRTSSKAGTSIGAGRRPPVHVRHPRRPRA